jgi:hypothetical protein
MAGLHVKKRERLITPPARKNQIPGLEVVEEYAASRRKTFGGCSFLPYLCDEVINKTQKNEDIKNYPGSSNHHDGPACNRTNHHCQGFTT